jgi:hypothetical protein
MPPWFFFMCILSARNRPCLELSIQELFIRELFNEKLTQILISLDK